MMVILIIVTIVLRFYLIIVKMAFDTLKGMIYYQNKILCLRKTNCTKHTPTM